MCGEKKKQHQTFNIPKTRNVHNNNLDNNKKKQHKTFNILKTRNVHNNKLDPKCNTKHLILLMQSYNHQFRFHN